MMTHIQSSFTLQMSSFYSTHGYLFCVLKPENKGMVAE